MTEIIGPASVPDFALLRGVYDRLGEQNDLLRQLLDRLPPQPAEKPEDEGGPVLVTEPAPAPTPRRKGAAP